jgi:hypothetical protein
MRTLDLDLENNEFDNFISRRRSKGRKGLSSGILSRLRGRPITSASGNARASVNPTAPKAKGFGAALGAKLGACLTQVGTQNPEFANMDNAKSASLSISEKARYQSLMSACLSARKIDPNRPAGGGVRHIRPTDFKGMLRAGLSSSSINKFKRANQKRIDNAQVSTTMPPPFTNQPASIMGRPADPPADPSLGLDTPDVLPDTPDVLPTTGGEMPPPRPAAPAADDKKGKMKNYFIIGGLVVAAFLIYKSV